MIHIRHSLLHIDLKSPFGNSFFFSGNGTQHFQKLWMFLSLFTQKFFNYDKNAGRCFWMFWIPVIPARILLFF